MCTVTFIPAKDKFFITSNRDEKSVRKQAIPPQLYRHGNNQLVYPKDAQAGGTWVATQNNGNAAVLLNGGFVKHQPSPSYRQSRGIIFLEVMTDDDPVKRFSDLSLFNIEPFTLVIFHQGNLFECRWDGHKKHSKRIDKVKPHIWSSVTLYEPGIIKKREQWFAEWLSKNSYPNQEDILHFHQFGGDGNSNNDLRMNRNGIMLTVSVTGIELNNEYSVMQYLDLKDHISYREELHFVSSYASQ